MTLDGPFARTGRQFRAPRAAAHGYREIEHLDHAGIRDRYMHHQTELVPGPTPFFASVMARV
jgi:hypothetical protein